MSQLSLTVLGSINEDIVVHADRLPRPGETVAAEYLWRTPGGKGANQAAAAARLGAKVDMVGATGQDSAGRRCVEALRAAGVDVGAVRTVERATGTAVIVVDALGENQIAVVAGANEDVVVNSFLALSSAVLCQLEIPLHTVMEAAQAASGFFALNAAPARRLPEELVARCDLVVVNEEEHAALPEVTGARLLAVTYGSAGAVLLRGGREVARCAALEVGVKSTVGAGDAFCAGLVVALLSGQSEQAALQTACTVAAAAVGSTQTQPPLKPLAAYLGHEPRFGSALAESSGSSTPTCSKELL